MDHVHSSNTDDTTNTTSVSQDAKDAAVNILAHFANLKLAGDRYIRDAVTSLRLNQQATSSSNSYRTINRLQHGRFGGIRRYRRHRRRAGRRPRRRVGDMTDAELEAELEARRLERARERERYARAMRVEKLNALESELSRLRIEISRMGGAGMLRTGGTPAEGVRGSLRLRRNQVANGTTPGIPPPPPPPMPEMAGEGDEMLDLERQTREKAERQRRREQKRREREANKKPLTLADIIRSAGPNPMRRLKPKTPKPTLFDDPDVVHGFVKAKDDLKSTENNEKKEDGTSGQGEKDAGKGGDNLRKKIGEGNKKDEKEIREEEERAGEKSESAAGKVKEEENGEVDTKGEQRKSTTVRVLFPAGKEKVTSETVGMNGKVDESDLAPKDGGSQPIENGRVDKERDEDEAQSGERAKAGRPADAEALPHVEDLACSGKLKDEDKTGNSRLSSTGTGGRAVRTPKQKKLSRDPVRKSKMTEILVSNEHTKENQEDNTALINTAQLPPSASKADSPTIRNLAKKKAALLAVRQRRRARKEKVSQISVHGKDKQVHADNEILANSSQVLNSDLSQLFAATNTLDAIGQKNSGTTANE